MVKYDPEKPIVEHLHPGEPYFLIRAQDALSTDTLLAYAMHASRHGLDPQPIFAVMVQFAEWQINNRERIKLPD